jgi:hypothetical protein
MHDLDKGEAAVIALAEEMQATKLLIDEKIGRSYAKLRGFTCVGTLGILIKAKQKGLISEVKPLLKEMQKNGIWLHENLVQQILSLANEI